MIFPASGLIVKEPEMSQRVSQTSATLSEVRESQTYFKICRLEEQLIDEFRN